MFSLTCLIISGYAITQTNYLPDKAENIRYTPTSPPNNMFLLVEQRGMVPYKGRSCNDASEAFTSNEDGSKSYGDNEWIEIHLQIQHYKKDGKITFDQIMQYNPPATDLNKKRNAFQAETNPDGTPAKNDLKIIDVADGKMLVINKNHDCVETKYKEYTSTYYYSYAVVGTTIIWIDAGYNTPDAALAVKMHNEIIEKIKKTGFN